MNHKFHSKLNEFDSEEIRMKTFIVEFCITFRLFLFKSSDSRPSNWNLFRLTGTNKFQEKERILSCPQIKFKPVADAVGGADSKISYMFW